MKTINKINEKKNFKKGDKVTYTKHFMFDKTSEVTATVVAIFPTKVMLDNGDTFYAV